MLEIWHNPRCRKSRETLAILQNSGKDFSIRLYLDAPPSEPEIRDMLQQLGIEDPRGLMRRGESIYKALKLKDETRPDKLVKFMAEYPILIERPVVSDGQKAVIGRPPDAVKVLF